MPDDKIAIENCNREIPVTEKPWWPHVNCPAKGSIGIMWGRGGWIFLLALFVLMGSASLSTYRVDAAEEEVKEMKEDIGALARNQHLMDEAQRVEAVKTGLIVKQLNALLEKGGVTKRIEPPPLKPSKLEPIE